MSDDISRDLGRIDAELIALRSSNADAKIERTAILSDLRAIRETLSEARGGWKTLMLVAGIAGVLGAFATKIASFLSALPR